MEIDLTAMILATGAVGTAAFGIVEAFKWTGLGTLGFKRVGETLGDKLMEALKGAYGGSYGELLKAQYRDARGGGILGKTLRQGIRIGLGPDNAVDLANAIGVVDPEQLQEAAKLIRQGEDLSDHPDLRAVVGRFELAVDARIDAALVLAESSYKSGIRSWASVVAIALAVLGAVSLDLAGQASFLDLFVLSLLVGIAAVPLAPIAKDVAVAIRGVADALGKKKAGAKS